MISGTVMPTATPIINPEMKHGCHFKNVSDISWLQKSCIIVAAIVAQRYIVI